jgi:hypothetical protein
MTGRVESARSERIGRGSSMRTRYVLVPGLLLASKLAVAQPQSSDLAAVTTPETWGTAAGYTTLMAHDFVQESYLDLYLGALSCPDGLGTPEIPYRAQGQLQVPDGARLSQLQLWAYDTDAAEGLTLSLYETCQAAGFNTPTSTLLASADTFGAIGTYFGFTPLNDHRVNNRDCAYTVRVLFNTVTVCRGQALQLQKVQVSWVRDVAPAPASPSFSDVPPSHVFFQYIEALAGSGVTGGCGSGKYCPDAPLTRGQMATFLARALGLEWP